MASARVSYQGEPGAFGEMAITHRWRRAADPIAAPTFDAALDLVVVGDTDFAVLPVWNSTVGDVHAAHRALHERGRWIEICDEVVTPVRHALLARPGATLESVRWAGSHPVALGQCSRFFRDHPAIGAVEAYDTAGAARELDRWGDHATPNGAADRRPWYADLADVTPRCLAVIANAGVAQRYGLVVLADGVQDDPENATRFAVLRRREGVRW